MSADVCSASVVMRSVTSSALDLCIMVSAGTKYGISGRCHCRQLLGSQHRRFVARRITNGDPPIGKDRNVCTQPFTWPQRSLAGVPRYSIGRPIRFHCGTPPRVVHQITTAAPQVLERHRRVEPAGVRVVAVVPEEERALPGGHDPRTGLSREAHAERRVAARAGLLADDLP